MNFLKHLIAAALALGAASNADAATIRGTWLLMDDAAPGVFTDTWSFNSADFDPLAAGTPFQDYFIFNPPADEDISISVTGTDGVTLDHFTLRIYADFSIVATQVATSADALSGGPYALTSGTYWLDLFGLVDTYGGHYLLTISGTQAETSDPTPPSVVPEPAMAALLLAGLGAIGALGRRTARAPRLG